MVKSIKSVVLKTSTDLYRSCAALASFSGTFDFKQEFIVEKVWFGLVSIEQEHFCTGVAQLCRFLHA